MDLPKSLQGSGALLVRGLNEDARSLGMHIARGIFVGTAFLGCLAYFVRNSGFGAPGLAAFKFMVYADTFFLALMGISYFSASIAEEREQQMLGLLKISGISPLGLLLGKSAVRLIPACVGLLLQVPLILLAITLGGVRYEQIGAAVCALLAFLVLLNNLSLWVSMTSPTAEFAGQRTTGIVMLAYFTPQILMIPSSVLPLGGAWWERSGWPALLCSRIAQWIRERQISSRLGLITESTFEDPWISSQVIFDLSAGLLLFLFCWATFETLTSDRELSVHKRPDGTKARKLTRGHSLTCWDNSFAWKEFYFTVGGPRSLWISFAGYLLIVAGIFAAMFAVVASGNSWQEPPISDLAGLIREFGPFPLIGSFALAGFLVFLIFSKSFTTELKEKTFGTLMLTPHTKRSLVVSLLRGRLLTLIPLLAIFLISAAWTLLTDNWLMRTPIDGINGWLTVLLTPGCVILAVLDASLWIFYAGLWRISVVNGTLAAITSILLFYGEGMLLWTLHFFSTFDIVLVTCLTVAVRIFLSLLFWKFLWWRTTALMDLRMAE